MLSNSLRRCFSTSTAQLAQHYTRTTLNPSNFRLVQPSFIPRSLLVLSTPANLPTVIEEAIALHQNTQIQVIVAGIDSVVPNSNRNGVSELWLDEDVKISKAVQVEERDDLATQPKERDGVNIVVARKNWKHIDANLHLGFGHSSAVDLTPANTVFSTGNLVTMFYFHPDVEQHPDSGHTLCDLSVEFPDWVVPSSRTVESYDKWTPLYDYATEPAYIITNSTGNLLKEVNGIGAAQFLEKNDALMSIASKETEVYVKIYKKDNPRPYKYQVIAGGGGWGAKANIIALSPDADVAAGDRIEFYMLTPTDRYSKHTSPIPVAELANKLTFETTFEEQGYEATTADNQSNETGSQVLENVFGCGSESGFRFNGIHHGSAGEWITISPSTK